MRISVGNEHGFEGPQFLLDEKGRAMGLFDRFFGKRKSASEKGRESTLNLAFVLLSEPRQPDTNEIVTAFREFAEPGFELAFEPEDPRDPASIQVVSLKLSSGENSFVALMPAPVPNGEAEQGVQYSVSRFRDDWELPKHLAHLIVTFHGTPDSSPIERLSRFTALLAAVIKSSPAVGVYWGNSGATHDSDYFLAIAADPDLAPKMTLWSGVSIAREDDGRFSLLSLGMEQFDLPNLLIVADENSLGSAMEWMYDLLFYVAQRGEPLPEGDTEGRFGDERLPVRYVRSPVDRKKKVCRLELQ